MQQQTLEYNGTEKKDEVIELKLSDAFAHPEDKGEFEWTAKVININTGNNNSLISKCKVLKEYVILTTEYNEKQTLENTYNDGVEVGKEKGIEIVKAQGIEFGERRKLIEMVYKKIKRGKTVEEIADDLEEDIEVINPIFNEIEKVGLDKSLEEIIKNS